MFKIYWTDENNQAHGQETAELAQALQITKDKRDAGYTLSPWSAKTFSTWASKAWTPL